MQTKSSPEQSAMRLRGVGKQISKHLARLDVHSATDLLFHLPMRYQDRTQIEAIRRLVVGRDVVIEGEIKSVNFPMKGRTKLLCELQDETGGITLRFFHVLSFQRDKFKTGMRMRCYGEAKFGPKGLEMMHPEFVFIAEGKEIPVEKHLTPFYPATEGLSQYMLRKLTGNALEWMESEQVLRELLPTECLNSRAFPSLKEALRFVHRPPQETSLASLMANETPAQQRLAFEELIAHRLSLLNLKQLFQSRLSAAFESYETLDKQFRAQLPFKLTAAQEKVLREIRMDLSKPYPMLRLVQGDVGSGKTVVAALAMLQAIENNYQAALMAPTELLAEQHYRVVKKWLEPLSIQVAFLSGNVKGAARKAVLESMKNGEAQIIIGTHALFQENVAFSKLGLVVIDEQHRFGVQQRAMLQEKGTTGEYYPHQLVMTATPIPRTLAMSFYADLDCSIIDELPPGRTPILTTVLASTRRDEIVERIRHACQEGRQAYWVCPLIDESEVIACQAATQTAESLQSALPNLKVGLIHGRMKASEKESAMRAFQQGETQLLVATTVIEVGVDVPNASLMIIENAERLGLSQLHQLRGRVGRGNVASHCVLLYDYLSKLAKERLTVMRETTDGFKIAQRDLELRGPGEVLGTRQTGELAFRVSDLLRDSDLLPAVHETADLIMQSYPHLIEPLTKRWLKHKQDYAKV